MDEQSAKRLENKYKNSSVKIEQAPKKMMSGGPGHGPGRFGGGAPKEKPKNTKQVLLRLWKYLREDRSRLIIVFTCVIISTVFTLAASYMLRPIINGLTGPNASAGTLLRQLIFMLMIYAVAVISNYTQSRIMITISQKASQKLRDDLFSKLQKLPLKFFDSNNHGDLMSRFTNDVDVIGEMLSNTMVQLISGFIMIIGTFSLMLATNIWLTLITTIMMPVLYKAGQLISKKSRVYFKKQQASLGTLNGYIEETMTGQKVVKVFCHEDKAIEEFEYLNDDYRDKMVHAQFFGGIMGPVLGSLGNLNYTLTACAGGLLCVLRGFDIGGFTIFVNYSRQFSRPINEISMQMNTIFSALAGAERVFKVMDEKPEKEDATEAEEVQTIEGWVVLKNVSFGYNPEKMVLKNISLHAKPGQKIALVGSTGAGKTTITNVLNRFYDTQEGEITIDGINIQNYKRTFLRKNIAVVLQDTHLFTGTVFDNIRYGRLDATDEEVIEAAKTANAHYFITRLEHGYNTRLERDGANLSQGQRQLLNIARASISKAPILILDEATSSVDTRTEKHIEEAMDRLMSDKTTFVIAHRLSTVRNADAILVLENGEIIERGDHDDLLAQRGRYYSLYNGMEKLD